MDEMYKDLLDHGAAAYTPITSDVSRDLPDTDLSDHGAIAYAPRSETWGTNDEELATQINMLMQASYSTNVDQVIPLLSAASLAKLVNYRYRVSANILDNSSYGLSTDDKERLGMGMNMDFAIINSIIASNPQGLEQIFSPTLYSGEQNLTDIFGVLESYKQAVDSIGVQIPLINGYTGKPLVDANGKVVTVQEGLKYLMAKKDMSLQPNGKTM